MKLNFAFAIDDHWPIGGNSCKLFVQFVVGDKNPAIFIRKHDFLSGNAGSSRLIPVLTLTLQED